MNAELLKAIAVAAELTGTELSKEAVRIMAADLSLYSEAAVLEALRRCRRELRGRLTLAAIIEHIDAEGGGDGLLGAEESWGKMALYGIDERASFSWTGEMREAWGAASPLMHAGDAIAARMAFIERYTRAVSAARARGEPVCWEMSFGWDRAGRVPAVVQAVSLGRISKRQAYGLLTNRLSEDPGEAQALLGVADTARLTFDDEN